MIKILLALLISVSAFAKPIRVAVIDTGAPIALTSACKEGHKDFTGEGLRDKHGHGTNVSGIIDLYANGADYCQIYLKYYGGKFGFPQKATIEAFKEAIRLKVDIINYSGGGSEYDAEEAKVVKEALDAGIFIIAAAGNSSVDLKTSCSYYPACVDSRIVVVGCKVGVNQCKFTNYGPQVDVYANGVMASAKGVTLSGTSQATAIVTGQFIRYWDKKKKMGL